MLIWLYLSNACINEEILDRKIDKSKKMIMFVQHLIVLPSIRQIGEYNGTPRKGRNRHRNKKFRD